MEASNSIFIDTWAWLALANRRDTYHKPVRENYLKLLEGGNRASPIPSEFPYLNAEAAPPFCHSSWEDKQMKGSTKQIPI